MAKRRWQAGDRSRAVRSQNTSASRWKGDQASQAKRRVLTEKKKRVLTVNWCLGLRLPKTENLKVFSIHP
jgi:hypothetical protein